MADPNTGKVSHNVGVFVRGEPVSDVNPWPITGVAGAPGDATEATLLLILAELQQKLEPGQEVALSPATLAALEAITVTVSGSVTVDGEVALDAATLAALETIELGAATLAALESITTDVSDRADRLVGETTPRISAPFALPDGVANVLPLPVDRSGSTYAEFITPYVFNGVTWDRLRGDTTGLHLSSATLAALESITVSGEVSLDAATLAALETIAITDGGGSITVDGPLTDTELRATPVPISGTVTANLGTIDGAATETTLASILAELTQKLEPGQSVALDAATLAALETISAMVEGKVAEAASLASVNPLVIGAATSGGNAKYLLAEADGRLAVSDGGSSLTVDGEVALSAATLSALETIELGATTLAALETISVAATSSTPTENDDITVDNTAGGVTLLSANANRKGALIQNTGSFDMRVTYDGSTPSTTHGKILIPGATMRLEMPYVPTAAVKAIRVTSNTTASAEERV